MNTTKRAMMPGMRMAPFVTSRPMNAAFNGESAVFAETMYEQWK